MSTSLQAPPLTYEQLRAKVPTNPLNIENEILETPAYIQMVGEECVRLGKLLEDAKVQLKAAEGITFSNAKRGPKVGGRDPSNEVCSAEVDKNQTIIDLRLDASAKEAEYKKWWELKHSFTRKADALTDYKSFILSGYVLYKKPTI